MGRKNEKNKASKKVKVKKKKSRLSGMSTDKSGTEDSVCIKKYPQVLIVDLNEGDVKGESKNEPSSLQEAFLKFREKKQVEISVADNKAGARNIDLHHQKELRRKFLNRCKKYIGVPYKKKYHKPGSVEYNSNLFLDCCGLIRRVLRDLSKDFGFRVGPWNQSYMFDTLPVVVNSEKQMKPGDLVFISGVYFNKKMRSQLHDLVHVEVWLGDGVKTIGARWHKGRVQIFDSYKFDSTSYHSMKYHFRSIDTWLQGVCKSFCERHPWKRPGHFRPSKRSVFFRDQSSMTGDPDLTRDPTAEESSAEDASDDDGATSSDSVLEKCCPPRDAPSSSSFPSITMENVYNDENTIKFISVCNSVEFSQKSPSREPACSSSSSENRTIFSDTASKNGVEIEKLRKPLYFFTTKRFQGEDIDERSVANVCIGTNTSSSDENSDRDIKNRNEIADGLANEALLDALDELQLQQCMGDL